MARPSPVPFCLVVKKGTKMCSCWSSGIPAPVSLIYVRTLRPERFSDFRGAETVEVQVSDTGAGIPLDQQLHIFVPFFTTKQKGTGLGLAICQRIVKNHQGTISVQSRVGEGSTFTIRFPALASEAIPEAVPLDRTPLPPARSDLRSSGASPLDDGSGKTPERRSGREKKKRRMAAP